MLQIATSLLLLPALVVACSSVNSTEPAVASPTEFAMGNAQDQPQSVDIWSLGGNGWALRIGDRMLIFDYVEGPGQNPPTRGQAHNLENGYIDPDELRSFDVYVFVTHSHQDHFDPVIFEWQSQLDQITYFFGWQAGNNPDHYYLSGPQAHTQVGELEVYTINSHHDDVPEVAYLVRVDGVTIYHNGDYRASYVEDFEYLHTISDHIDIAFVIGWPFVEHQHFQQAKLLAEMFSPGRMFAICREGDEQRSSQFAELLAEQGVDTPVWHAKQRGDSFTYSSPAE